MIGLVNDVEFDPCTYVIHSIFVHPTQSFVKKLFPWFFPCDEIEIPTQEIGKYQWVMLFLWKF